VSPPAPGISPELRQLLRRLKLGRLMPTLPERLALARANDLTHAEFLELIFSDEVTRRDATSAERRARAAGLDAAMRLDRWDATAKITYDRAVLDELFSLRFITGATNAIIMGPVGTGKTFLATALGHAAVRARHSVHFERAGLLLKRLRASRLDNSHDEQIRKLLRTDLLILDDFCLQAMDAADTADIYEIIVERHRAAATVVTSNREPPEWLALGRPAARPVRHRPAPARRLGTRHRRRVLPPPPETRAGRPAPLTTTAGLPAGALPPHPRPSLKDGSQGRAVFPAGQHSQPQNLPGPQGLAPLGLRHTLAVPAEPAAAQRVPDRKTAPGGPMPLANTRTLDPGRPQESSSPRSHACNGPEPVPSHWRKPGPMSLADDTLFFQLVSARYERASLIVTSNKPFGKAHLFR
jgi:DNA replication protein DnaC